MVDTNVVFEGVSHAVGAPRRIVDAWLTGDRFVPCVTLPLALEYEDVVGRKFKGTKRQRALEVLAALLDKAVAVDRIVRLRPVSSDPSDDRVVECVVNASALLCTRNRADFAAAPADLGFEMIGPEELVERLKL